MRDWDTDHFDMQWAAPRNDGGSRITGYELEARLWREPAWFKAGEVRRIMMMMMMMMMVFRCGCRWSAAWWRAWSWARATRCGCGPGTLPAGAPGP